MMKITVRSVVFCILGLAVADPNDSTQIENYDQKTKQYQLEVPGRDSITVIEAHDGQPQWKKKFEIKSTADDAEVKNLMTHIIHDLDGNEPRCYGPSCQEGYAEEDGFDEYALGEDKLKDFRDYPLDRLQAITALAAKLKKDKYKHDRFSQMESGEEDKGNVFTTWNRLKVKQHKHPFDDKDGWVTLEPVAWSTSKISKWKPNVKKQKPNQWTEDDSRLPDDDRFESHQGTGSSYNYQQKRPSLARPGFINNKLHVPQDYEPELPSKPTFTTWSKPQQASYPSMWAPDDGRRPHKPNCDTDENYTNDEEGYYGMSDSVVTDNRPANFPYEYEALHQAQSSMQKRPLRRPTQVVYAGSPEYDSDRSSRPPYSDGQWVLLSTTKGYKNKKRQRSLNYPAPEDGNDVTTMTSHQAVALTVLPVDKAHTNMTTSHGGLLEVEKSFQTVEESKRDLDKKNDLEVAATQIRPNKNRAVRRKIIQNSSPDSSTLLAAVGAGMVPATMAMVVPMMLGRRRRRRDSRETLEESIDKFLHKYI
ncbi:uncharacterized protein LOC114246390 [Bombyx mandarina]|uniref:Uncharacterized protein LOC114246390 n=1 Tax=Bombyx mandarina TaxID=7092 RepID=A0A6J2JZ33_BOMMA|nr:uncharacterized protein LOC114246390 [Bombyx mandarina]